ncbi:GTPase-activating protein of the rho/rac family, partial [Suhomyces tanzawaensis NRRL Y-17324]
RRKNRKICKKCGVEITGQFVRALSAAYHVECFKCHDCGKPCAAKFFPFEYTDPTNPETKYQVPLCEYDYFKKLELICHNCNNALRGPYITALGNKYHLEHFKCNVCQRVFESDESYYEHEDSIYCHFHYSKLYASHCEGCHSSIVKQFVELYRGGRNQQWHPECYMVHKFWNVCIMADSVGLQSSFTIDEDYLSDLKSLKKIIDDDSEKSNALGLDPKVLLSIEQQIENVVMQCWLTLSGFEETTAACISDMLLNACTGNQANGLLSTVKLVLNIEILFVAFDHVSQVCQSCIPILRARLKSKDASTTQDGDLESSLSLEQEYFQTIKKEPRNLSGKVMSYLAILRKSNQISQSGSLSAELLSVITGCAHYLKLLIRIGLNNALRANKLLGTTSATDLFLNSVVKFEKFNKRLGDETESDITLIKKQIAISSKATDACVACSKSIEKSCARFDDRRWHLKCFKCSACSRVIPPEEFEVTKFDAQELSVFCKDCDHPDGMVGFEHISDLSQLVYLLHIALSRSLAVMKVDIGSKFQPKIEQIPENQVVRPKRQASTASAHSRIDEAKTSVTENNYSKTISDVTRLRTRRQSQKLSNSIKKNARKSVILEAPVADKAKEDEVNMNSSTVDESMIEELSEVSVSTPVIRNDRKASAASHLSYIALHNENEHFNVKAALKIRDEPQRQLTNGHLDRTSDLLKNEKSLTLDDIPRIVAAEQARDQRPNAFKHHNSLYQRQKPMDTVKNVNNMPGNNNGGITPTNALESIINAPSAPVSAPKRSTYYSELSKDEHFVMRHIAVEALLHITGNKYVKEEVLASIQTKKQPTFWDKFKFGGQDKRDKNMAVFGVDLQDLTKKYGVDSDLGVGPSKLRIPIVVDDVINALRQKDMSVEGIFRLNGNIKKLKDLTEQINKSPLKSPDFSSQSVVQLAALMKKWLRELPNPLLTFNLYDLWISSQAEKNLVIRKRILQLVYCMLPRSHRNLVEVLLYFFSWVASFAEIDEETGSKMDIHNLATVIAPNILFAKQAAGAESTPQSGETYFLAIEVVNQLIEIHEELSVIPEDLLQFFERCGFSGSKSENLTTKEIMQRLEKESKEDANFFRNYEKLSAPDVVSNQVVHTNTISRGHSKV